MQRHSQLLQLLTGHRRLLRRNGIVAGRVVDFGDTLTDLFGRMRLLQGRRRNLRGQRRDLVNLLHRLL